VLSEQLQELVDIVAQTADRPFAETWGRAVSVAIGIIVRASLPLVAVIVVTDLVSGMAGTFSLVFSFDPVKPGSSATP
jgi:type III secretory pathway component EscU